MWAGGAVPPRQISTSRSLLSMGWLRIITAYGLSGSASRALLERNRAGVHVFMAELLAVGGFISCSHCPPSLLGRS